MGKSKIVGVVILSLILIILYGFPIESAQTTTSFAHNDSYVDSVNTGSNFGTSTTFLVDGDREYQGLLNFDISAIVENATINSAKLYIYGASGTSGRDISVYAQSTAWSETGVTWNTVGSYNTTLVGSDTYNSGYNEIDVTTAVRWWTTRQLTNNGFRVLSTETSLLTFNAKEFTGTTRDPYLNVSWDYPSPTMYFISPANNTQQSTSSVNFVCNATVLGVNSNANITRFEFYVCDGAGCDPTSEFTVFESFNETDFGSGNKSLQQNFTTTIAEGAHEWTCTTDVKFEDGTTISLFTPAEQMRRFTVDSTAPAINFTSPTPSNNSYGKTFLVNVTASDATLQNITVRLSNTTSLVNTSVSTSSPFFLNFTSLSDGNYSYNATATDGLGNSNTTETRTFILDKTNPLIDFASNSETNAITKSNGNIFVNTTITELNFANITFRLFNSTSLVNTTTYSTRTTHINFTSLPDGSYSYNVSTTDLASNTNTTSTRTATIDSTFPQISYASNSDSDGLITKNTNIFVNTTITESSINNISFTLYNKSLNISGLVGYWNFDRNMTTLYDLSGKGNNGALSGAIWNSSGQLNGKFDFDGVDDYIRVENSASLNFGTNNFTISAWVFAKQNTSTAQRVIAKAHSGATSFGGWNLIYPQSGTADRLSMAVFNASGSSGSLTVTGVTQNQWHHIVARVERTSDGGSNITVWINGVFNSTNKNTVQGAYDNSSLFVGIGTAPTTSLSTFGHFNGSIDEVFIFNRSLSSEEIEELYLRRSVNRSVSTSTRHINFTSLSENKYHYFADVLDNSGLYNSTLIRNVEIDSTAPTIAVNSPANNTNTTATGVNFDVNLTSFKVAWFNTNGGSNQTFSTCVSSSCDENNAEFATSDSASLSEGANSINIYANDSAGNIVSVRWTINKDSTAPTTSYVSPTESSGTSFNRNYILVNVTATDSGVGLNSILIRLYNSTHSQINSSTTTTSPNFINFSSLAEGIYFYNVSANDTLGNTATLTSRNITLDRTNPSVTIAFPLNISYTTAISALNYSASDTNLRSCWYSTNGGTTNTSVTCGTNVTGLSASQGSNTWYVSANDSAGNINTTSITFFVDSQNPQIQFVSPTDTTSTYLNRNYILVNVTASDATLQNITVRLSNTTSLVNTSVSTSSPFFLNFTSLSEGNYSYNATAVDSVGNTNRTETRNVTIDTTLPLVSYESNTEADQSNYTRRNIFINVSVTELNFANITFRLFNSTAQYNSTTFSTLQRSINFTSLPDDIYTFNVSVTDLASNSNTTQTRTIRIDNIAPSLTVQSPTSTIYHDLYTYNISLNLTAIDSVSGVANRFYSLNGASNVTFTGNASFIAQAGSNTLRVHVNDTVGNLNSTTIQFNLTFTPRIDQIVVANATKNYTRNLSDKLLSWWTFDYDSDDIQYDSTGLSNATISNNLNNSPLRVSYKFNNDLTDTSINQLTLTATNTAFNSSGKLNQALQFNGVNSNVTFSLAPMDSRSQMTVAMWVYPTNLTVNRTLYTIGDRNTLELLSDGKIRLFIDSRTSGGSNVGREWITNNSIPINQWSHVAVTIAGLTGLTAKQTYEANIWINGTIQPFVSNGNIGNNSAGVTQMYIGVNATGGNVFQGLIDDFRTYVFILNQQDMNFIYNSTNGTEQNLSTPFQVAGKQGTARKRYGQVGDMTFATSTTPSALALTSNDTFSFSIWVYPETSFTSQRQEIFGRSFNQAFHAVRRNDSQVDFLWGVRTGSTLVSTSKTNYDVNEWHHLVGVHNATNRRIYFHVDGVYDSTGVDSSSINFTSTQSMDFSAIGNGDGSVFTGSFDEIRIYNKSLSQDEVEMLYYLVDPTYQELANVTLNVTAVDEDTSQSNLFYEWFVDGVSIAGGVAQTVFNYIYRAVVSIVTLVVTDSEGNIVEQNFSITTTFINPTINFTSPTPSNNSLQGTSSVNINVTGTEANRDTVILTMDSTNYTLTCSGSPTFSCNRTLSLSDGNHTYFVSINDSVGNTNRTETRLVRIDTTKPTIIIVRPQAINYNTNTSLPLNITYSDVNLNACWYNFNNGANTTITCNQNYTFNISEGSHTLYAFANDSAGNNQNASVSFTVNLAPPSITLDSPTDQQWLNSTNVTFRYTPTDSDGISFCRLYGNFTGTFALNQTDSSITSGVQDQFNLTLNQGGYIWNILCQDTGGNSAWGNPSGNNTFYVDSVYPLISYGTGTLANNTNTTNTFIYINVSVTEANEDTITFSLYNSTSSYNITSSQSDQRTINFTSLPDGIYFYNVSINDSAGNFNKTETRKITLDDTEPSITIVYPQPINYAITNFSLNVTITDNLVGLSSCWYNVINISNSVYLVSNTTLTNCGNTSFSVHGGDYDFEVTVYANDTLNNIGAFSHSVGVRTISPAVNLQSPPDHSVSHLNNFTNVAFNFTVVDASESIDTCQLYGNWTGTFALNQTKTSISESGINHFNNLTLSEGTFLYNVHCNDTLGNIGTASNRSFTIDVTKPLVNIISISSTASPQTVSFTYNFTEPYPQTCFYSVFDSTGSIDGANSNVSITNCSTTSTATVTTAPGTYNLTVYVKDYASNVNSSTMQFSVSAVGAGGGGGGGGGAGTVGVPATNYSITTITGGDTLDAVLAKDSTVAREREFILVNQGIEQITVELICDTELLTEEEINLEGESINICDYVTFQENVLTLSTNELQNTRGSLFIETPPTAEFGDEYHFNVLAVEETSSSQVQYSKLSVVARVPVWGAFLKWSHIPLQSSELPVEEKDSYPVAPISILVALIISTIIFFILRKDFPLTSMALSLVIFFISMISLVYVL